ncbi:PREDICTED: eukaryotic translation initiation factor 4B1 [Camelina sativa]|uniref:Eukaryotic translation initiation factor 4B1 n=1 Tax=Camelina sativa TaxID=90675 RepID=A0ABM0TET4_CAMSA|nr:PREDICTED: eukaryotic translation initiation factor 4B1 [Camelina sativa]
MSKPWGGIGIGAWADEAERADEEQAAEAASATADTQSFPSLREAAAATATNAKSRKMKKMSLSEFTTGGYTAPGGRNSVGLTHQEILQLPTGPRQRSEDEMQPGRLGGGFSSYGGRSGGGGSGRMGRDRDDSDGSWGGGGGRRPYGGGFDDDRRGNQSRVSDFPQPSRADEVDDWGKAKKPLPSFDQGRQGRYGGGGGGGFGGGGGGGDGGLSGRADGVDNWGAGKKQAAPVRSSTFGSSFGDSGRESDRWSRGEVVGGGVQEERRRLVLEPRKVVVDSGASETPPVVEKTSKPNPFGAARPREEILAEKGLDWKKIDSDIEAKKGSSQTSRPTSAHSSRPSSAQSNRSESSGLNNVVKPRPKVNPFGDAKPREVLLEEQGKDWRKMDMELEHRRVDRPETDEEKMLKEEIEELRKKLEKESIAPEIKDSEQEPGSNNNHNDLPEILRGKEKDLEILTRELDDKVRFRQKAIERPGSGAGRTGTYSERSHSRAGSIDETRSFESTERPRSRGAVDAWVRPVDDQRRNFQGSKERGFFSNRSSSREGW